MIADRERGSSGQTFLVGQAIYLRPPQASDAARSVAWRSSVFPASVRTAADELENDLPKEAAKGILRLVACRLDDDEPVGSARVDVQEDWPTAYGHLFTAPSLGDGGQGVKAEMIDLLTPWLAEEKGAISVVFDLDGGEPAALAAADAAGLRPAFRVRQALWRDGGRHDWVAYQKLHPAWAERLGDPGAGSAVAGDPPSRPRYPAPRRWPERPFPVPNNSVMVGERLALRPLEADEAETIARTFMRETEPNFGSGRIPLSPLVLAAGWARQGKHEPPDEINFAIVLRETGEVIGDNGIHLIDWIGRSAETVSWIYRPEHRGGGLGTEAKHLLLEYAFERLGLHLVWSWVLKTNERSAAALRKQGYRAAGRIDWIGVGRGEFQSAHLFDLLADEWRAARR